MQQSIEDIERLAENPLTTSKQEHLPWDWISDALKSWMPFTDTDDEAVVESEELHHLLGNLAETASHEAIQWTLQHRCTRESSTTVSQESCSDH